MFEGKLATLGGLMAAAVLGVSLPACAEPLFRNLNPHGESRAAAAPPVGHYVATLNGRSFVLDRVEASPEVLLKFDDETEVWVLEPSPKPGGGKIYRNDVGDRVLSESSLGGLTLFTPREPDGLAVSTLGDAEDLALPPTIPDERMTLRSAQAAYRTSRAAQAAAGRERAVNFYTPFYTPATSPVFFDAITITSDALVSMARRKEAKSFLSKLERVLFVVGAKPDVGFNGSVLTVTVTPGKGFAGRPSSSRIMKTCLKK
jgi:hypothetical protein